MTNTNTGEPPAAAPAESAVSASAPPQIVAPYRAAHISGWWTLVAAAVSVLLTLWLSPERAENKKLSNENEALRAAGRKITAKGECQPAAGGFTSNGVSHSEAKWEFDEDRASRGKLDPSGPDATHPQDKSQKSIVLERLPPDKDEPEVFAQPDHSDFTRIEWVVPKDWHGKGIRVTSKLKWVGVKQFAASGRSGTVAVNFKAAGVPKGFGVREIPLGAKDPTTDENVYGVLLAEAQADRGWREYIFPIYWVPSDATNVRLRIGLHAVYGKLYVDDVSLEKCE